MERQMKGWVSATISVLVADYAFILGAYNLILWGASWWMKNKKQGGVFLCSSADIQEISVMDVSRGMGWREGMGIGNKDVIFIVRRRIGLIAIYFCVFDFVRVAYIVSYPLRL